MAIVNAAPPNVIHWTPRSGHHGDCVVIALCHATGFSYEETLAAALSVNAGALDAGITAQQARAILKVMGFRARVTRKYDLDDDPTGILFIKNRRQEWHAVYLWAGRVINMSKHDRGALWLDPDEYLKNGGWKDDALVTLEG